MFCIFDWLNGFSKPQSNMEKILTFDSTICQALVKSGADQKPSASVDAPH